MYSYYVFFPLEPKSQTFCQSQIHKSPNWCCSEGWFVKFHSVWWFRWGSTCCSSRAVGPDSSWVMVSALSHTWSLVRQGKEWLAVFWSVWFLGVSRSTGAQRLCVHHVSPNRAPSTCLEMGWVTGLYLVPPSVFHWTFLKEWGVPVWPLFYLRQSPVARTSFCWIRVSTVNLATQSISFWSRAENGWISGSVSKGENSKALSQKTSLA